MAGYRRFFVPDISADEIEIAGEEFHHARDVLRVAEGDGVILSAGTPEEAEGRVTAVGKRGMTVRVTARRRCEREPRVLLRLIAGYLKGDKTELVVQKATELGVGEIAVFCSRNSSAYVGENKLERLNRVAREAAKQCGRSVAPPVAYYPDLASALDAGARADRKLFFCEFAERSEGSFAGIEGSLSLVVGSEGGFTPEEYDLAREKGYLGMSLGRRILRAETAAIAAMAVAAYAAGELDR